MTLDELSVQMFDDLTSLRLMGSPSMTVMALQIFDDECVSSRIADPFNHKVRVRRATMRAAGVCI